MKRLILLPLLALTLVSCGDEITPGRTEGRAEQVLKLPVMTVETVKQYGAEQFVGSVESRDQARLVSRSSGKVTNLAVREGNQVKADQLLLEISDNSAREQLRATEAAIEVATRQMESARAKLTLARQTAARYEQLLKAQAVTPQEYDQVTAELNMARQQLAAAEAEVDRGEAERDRVVQQNSYNRVVAPFAGQVVSVQIKQGATVLPGTPLLVIDREGERQARVKVPERLLGQIKVGTVMAVELPSLQKVLDGTVLRVQGGSDPASRSYDVIIELPDGKDVPTGIFARARRTLPSEELLLIPETAVTMRGQLTGVFLVEDQVLKFRLVRLGRRFGDRLEVLSGLEVGDRIVSAEVNRAHNGARVE